MNRVKATASVAIGARDIAPVSGTPQYFTNGNPATPTPATVVPGYFLNMVQDELLAVITAAGLTPDDANWGQLLQAIQGLVGHGRLLGFQTFTANGTYTPIAGMGTVIFEAQASGGAGGGTAATGVGQSACGSGGGAGGYGRGRFTAAAVGASQPVTIGSAVVGTSGANGSNGLTTSVGALISAPGGGGGSVGVASAAAGVTLGVGAGSGAVSGGNIESIPGLPGQAGSLYSPNVGNGGLGAISRMGLYGNGGDGAQVNPSTGATPGGTSRAGKVIAWEFS